MKETTTFDAVLTRLKTATSTKGDTEFAKSLGLGQSSVSGAKTRGKIPPAWIETVAQKFNISANWLFFGEGPMKRGEKQESGHTQIAAASAPQNADMDELQQECRELRKENRELYKENRQLLKDNGNLRVELAELKAKTNQNHFAPKTEQNDSTNYRTDND